MVEKRIEFYFSKHPHTELDCGWSRKGSSNYERSLNMAKTCNNSRDPKLRSKRLALATETTDAHPSLGRKAVTLEFVKEGNYDVYPESSRSN